MKRFLIDFEGEEEYAEDRPKLIAPQRAPHKKFSTVAFTYPEMLEFLSTTRVGKMRVRLYAADANAVFVSRGGNDKLVLFYNNDRHRWNVDYKLFDNRIATLDIIEDKGPVYLELRDAGWKTKTTKDRINTLLNSAGIDYRIIQIGYEWFIAPNDPERTWQPNERIPWGDGKTFAVELP